jgi:hypothetical protein
MLQSSRACRMRTQSGLGIGEAGALMPLPFVEQRETEMMYGIHCAVWGGITGHRQSMMKGNDGEIATYATREEAENEARNLNISRNGPNAKACFSYSVRELR